MKIFDFTDGKKGKELGNRALVSWTDGWLVTKKDVTFKVELTNAPLSPKTNTVDWCEGAGTTSRKGERFDLLPSDFGVGAILICLGDFGINGHESWHWHVIGTTEWNREACKRGILKFSRA